MELYTFAQNLLQQNPKNHIKNLDLDTTLPNEKSNLIKNRFICDDLTDRMQSINNRQKTPLYSVKHKNLILN